MLKVGPDPTGNGSREVTVVPVKDERKLRNLAWIEGNRRKVDELTNGPRRLHLHAGHGIRRLTSFNRYFYAQTGRRRRSSMSGSTTAASSPATSWRPEPQAPGGRHDASGADMVFPLGGIYGPKVMITNEFAGSGGDALPW